MADRGDIFRALEIFGGAFRWAEVLRSCDPLRRRTREEQEERLFFDGRSGPVAMAGVRSCMSARRGGWLSEGACSEVCVLHIWWQF